MWINDFDVNTNPKSIMDALKEIEEYNQSFRYTTHPFFKARRDAEYLYNILVNMNEYTIYVDMNKMMQKNYDALRYIINFICFHSPLFNYFHFN